MTVWRDVDEATANGNNDSDSDDNEIKLKIIMKLLKTKLAKCLIPSKTIRNFRYFNFFTRILHNFGNICIIELS